jgi:multisubunit Na+/H+ antiporter MnhB subunit
MTDKHSIIPRVIGAIIAALVFIAVAMLVLRNFQPFELGVSTGGLPFIPINDYATAGTDASTMLWAYRVIDVLVQGLLLAAAAIGAAALFRLEVAKKGEKEE